MPFNRLLSASLLLALCCSFLALPRFVVSLHSPFRAGIAVDSVRSASSLATAQCSQPSPKLPSVPAEQWFSQPLDHFSASPSVRFPQRYWYNNTYCSTPDCSAAPFVLLVLPEEAGVTGDYTKHSAIGSQFKVPVVTLEHRYYGNSVPNGCYDTWNLAEFTVEQNMEDFIELRAHINDQYSLSSSLPWILDGCSYAGAVSAWTRQKYPSVFQGSIAGSSVIEARLDFSQYTDEMAKQIPPTCRSFIAKASSEIVSAMDTAEGRESIGQQFSFCSSQGSDPDPLAHANNRFLFSAYVFNQISQIVQYASEAAIESMCSSIMGNGTESPMAALGQYMSQAALQPGQCMFIDYWSVVKNMAAVQPDDFAFAWQQCTQLGIFQTTEGSIQQEILPPYFNTTGYLQYCFDQFQVVGGGFPGQSALSFTNSTDFDSFPRTRAFNDAHGSHAIQVTNTLFINGGQDPYHFLSNWNVNQLVGLTAEPTSNNGVLFYEGFPHCQFGANHTEITASYISKWLNLPHKPAAIEPEERISTM